MRTWKSRKLTRPSIVSKQKAGRLFEKMLVSASSTPFDIEFLEGYIVSANAWNTTANKTKFVVTT